MTSRLPRRLLVPAVLALTAAQAGAALAGDDDGHKGKGKQTIMLDNVAEHVHFNDGDSFRILDGARKGQKARLVGYNTLEAYGPVHFWGDANGWDLYHVNEQDIELAQSEQWECTSIGKADGYGRILVLCPELRKRMIAAGFAHVYAYGDEEPDPDLVALQLKAQNERVGMWKYGIPAAIVTSVHSIDEKDPDDPVGGDRKEAYNRLADTRTGKTFQVKHSIAFKPCDVFCHSGSCMVYVPFDSRFGDKRPACMKGKQGELNKMGPHKELNAPMPNERD